MYKGDRARQGKPRQLRLPLPSALTIARCASTSSKRLLPQTIFVSATPADYEHKHAGTGGRAGGTADGARRPGASIVRPAATQVDDLLTEINLPRSHGTSACS
jgi:excinuclease ABC subunit B